MLEEGCVGLRLGILLFQIGSVIFGHSDWLRSCLPTPHHPRNDRKRLRGVSDDGDGGHPGHTPKRSVNSRPV
jgi:hypothetical protein